MIKAQCEGFLNTPALWEGKQFGLQQFEFPSLKLESFQAIPIPRNIRLGHQIEYVFKQLIEDSDTYEVILYNLPIRQEKRTIGEIDFILKNKINNQLLHVELTYKFYIINPEIPEPVQSLIGPNRRDAFVAKMEKIKNVQYTLLHTVEGIKALNDRKIDHLKIEHQCCFKAQLFKPYRSQNVCLGILNKKCLSGYWLRYDDFNSPEFANAQYYMPTKSEWIIHLHDQVEWRTHFEMMIDINVRFTNEQAPLIWMKDADGDLKKIFVVWW